MSNIIYLGQSQPQALVMPAMEGEFQGSGSYDLKDRSIFLEGLHQKGAFYDVIPVGNYYNLDGQYLDTGKKTLINGSTGKPISVMSESYTVVQNKDIFSALDYEIAKSGLNLQGAYTKVDIAQHGAQVAVHYIFPAHSIDCGREGDKTSLMITAINSFNGTTGFAIYLGAFRGYCFNMQVFGTKIVQYKKNHCKDLSIDKAAMIIGSGIEVFNMEGEVWKKMAQTKMTQEQAYFALASFADVDTLKYPTYQAYKSEYSVLQQRTTKLENYERIYKKYVGEMGESEFALYNTLTHIATHGSAKSGDKAQAVSTFDTRQKVVAKVCQQYITSYRMAA